MSILADDLLQNQTRIIENGQTKWVAAKPEAGPFAWRIHDAIKVLKGEAVAVTFKTTKKEK